MSEPAHVFCPWCGAPTRMDYVHGHAQCDHCKTNIAPCCDGAVECDTGKISSAPPTAGAS